MALAHFGAIPLHCESWGSGPLLVLLHAGGSTGAQWQRVAALLQAGQHCLAPDLIGQGRTGDWPGPGPLTHDVQAALVAAVIEHEGRGAVDIVGHSYGGASALRLVLARPELVRSLVLIEPVVAVLLREIGDPLFAEYQSVAESFLHHAESGAPEQGWREFLDYRNGPGSWAAMPDKARARFLGQTAQTAAGFRANLSNPTTLDACRAITTPTTVLCGGATTAPDRRVTELLADAIPGSHHAVIPDAGHMAPLSHPEPVAEAIRAHLARLGRPPRNA